MSVQSIDDQTTVKERVRGFHIANSDLADPGGLYRDMHAQCPVGHSDLADGFWLISTYRDQTRIFKDPATFSSVYSTIPKMSVPNMLIPLNYDPPTTLPIATPSHRGSRRLQSARSSRRPPTAACFGY